MTQQPDSPKIKVYSKKEMREMYCISRQTLNNWLKLNEKKIGKIKGRLFTPKQVKLIFELLGTP
jgi:hypothetical protein